MNYSLLSSLHPTKTHQSDENCQLHEQKRVKFHCVKCKTYFCSKCVVLHTAEGHQIVSAGNFIDQQIQQITAKINQNVQKNEDFVGNLERKVEIMERKRNAIDANYQLILENIEKERKERLKFFDEVIVKMKNEVEEAKQLRKRALTLSEELFQMQHSQSSISLKKSLLEKATLSENFDLSPQFSVDFSIKRLEIPIEGVIQVEIKRKKAKVDPKLVADVHVSDRPDTQRLATWQYYNNRGNWVSYNWDANYEVEKAFKSGRKQATVGRYRIDLVNYQQSNVESGYYRPIRRVFL